MLFARLLGRALRWRAASSFAVFVVAVVAVLSAVIGPIYLDAASRIVLTQRLAGTSHLTLDLFATRDTLPLTQNFDLRTELREVGKDASSTPWYGPTVVAESTQITVKAPNRVKYGGRIGAIDDQCQHLRFVSGACPTGLGQTAISMRAAKISGYRLGDYVVATTVKDTYPLREKITGIYQPIAASGAFWRGWGLFDQRPALYQFQLSYLDTMFVSQAELQNRVSRMSVSVRSITPLLTSRVAPNDESALRGIVASAQAKADELSRGQLYTVKAASGLPGRLDDIDHELSLTRTLVDLATLQLALLAIGVLYAIVSATATAHGGEVALAKLRGRRPIAILAQGLAEPIVLVLAAAPVGAVLAWLAVREAAPHTLGPVSVMFPHAALLVTFLTALAAVLAACLAARRIVRAPVGALLRRGNDTESSKVGLLVADVAALVIALAGLVQLEYGGVLTSGKPNPLSALAPTLLAVAVAVVGMRLLPLGARAAILATRESKRLVPFLAVRQILRRANSTRSAVLVSVALALATLAITTWTVAGANRDIRAEAAVGADRVLTVSMPNGVALDLENAVAKADPGGHDALAAEILPVNSTQILAVQTRRMPGIAAWRSDYAPASLSKIIDLLDPTLPAPLTVVGRVVQVDLNVRTLTAGVPLTARLLVSQPNHAQATVDLGNLRTGAHTYRADLPTACATSCRVAAFALSTRGGYDAPIDPNKPQYRPEFAGVLTRISGQAQHSTNRSYFESSKRWRSGGPGGDVELSPVAAGLAIIAHPDVGTTSWPELVANDVPDHLPAVIGTDTAKLYPGAQRHDIVATGIDATAVPLDAGVVAAVLPQLGRIGSMIDLGLAHRQMTQYEAPGVEHQVWLRRGAPTARIEKALAAQGVKVVGSDTAAAHRVVLDHTGPAYADTVFLIAALAAMILAIGGAVLAALVTARRRSYELAALEAVGIRPRTLRWASAVEQGLLIGLGAAFGVAAGIGGSAMALPSTPIFVDPADGPPIEYSLPWATLGVLIAGLVVVLGLLCVVMARAIEGQATATRLREAGA